MSTPWSKDRREELLMLIDLLRDCGSINSGTRTLDRLARIERVAKRLMAEQLIDPRDSFVEYLRKLALGEGGAK